MRKFHNTHEESGYTDHHTRKYKKAQESSAGRHFTSSKFAYSDNMIIYKDLFTGKSYTSILVYKLFVFLTGDELFSDSYKIRIIDDIFYEVEGKVSYFMF